MVDKKTEQSQKGDSGSRPSAKTGYKAECPCRDIVNVVVKVPADLSSTGKDKWRVYAMDKCLAPIVSALQKAGIDMRGSCCGHGKCNGDIHLQDGRILIIKNNADEYLTERTGAL